MKVYISVDIEGISGVVHPDQGTMGHAEYDRARRLMTGEANAAIQGALEAGATRVLVNDSHGGMRNLLIEELHAAEGVELITGTPKPHSMVEGLDESFDVAFFVGYHSRAGTLHGTIDHTFSGNVLGVWLNDIEVGEIGLNAAMAGHYGVPVTLVTGDQAAVDEAQALLGPGVRTVAVKQATSRYAARCLLPEEAQRRIREAARLACAASEPWRLAPPIRLVVAFRTSAHADVAELVPFSKRLDGRRLQFTADDYPTVYRALRAMVTLAGQVQN